MAKKPFVNNPEKDVVRRQWDGPLLRHLHKKLGVRYRYCGLPGVELIDVLLWRDMIEDVIAFEPPDKDGEGDERRRSITALRRNMAKYGIKGRAYFGSFEEVVVLRRDFDGTAYTQGRLVTLYNLDFCNEIGSKILTSDGRRECLRFESLRQILLDQHECFRREKQPTWFILMLTFRNQMHAGQLRRFLRARTLISATKEYHDKCHRLDAIPANGNLIGTHAWAIKAFLINTLTGYFGTPNLDALFFPCVLYQGTKTRTTGDDGKPLVLESPMFHSLVLCRFGNAEAQAPDHWPEGFLGLSSVSVSGNAVKWTPQVGEEAAAGSPDTVGWLKGHGKEILKGL